jgi:hypothetical protein
MLNVTSLQSGISSVFRAQLPSGSDVAKRIADEYNKYCSMAMAPPGKPIFKGIEKNVIRSALAACWGQAGSSPAMVATILAQSVQAYWLAPPVMFTGGPAMGVAISMAGFAALVPAITAALSNLANSEDSAALALATALDVATRTVLVVYSTPTPPAGPPPPAMLI